MVEFLAILATGACAPNPGLPIPYREPAALEIELDLDPDSEVGSGGLAWGDDLSPVEISREAEEESAEE